MHTDKQVQEYVAKRRQLLAEITHGSLAEALAYWPPAPADWAMRMAFAERQGMEPDLYIDLYALTQAEWAAQMVLCHNPSVPIELLARMAGISSTEQCMSDTVEETEPQLSVDDIRRFARAVLRKRKNEF